MITSTIRSQRWHFFRPGSWSHYLVTAQVKALVLFVVITVGLNLQLPAYTQADLQTADDNTIETIPLEATVQVSPPQITIETYAAGTFDIYRKAPSVNTWTPIATGITLAATGTWTDNTVSIGTPYEYKFVNTADTADSNHFYPTGYIICGIQVDQTQPKGIMAVVAASDLAANLPTEYAQYKTDLVADGWTVREIQVPRAANYNGIGNGAIASVKVNAGGSGFTNGDVVYLSNTNGSKALGTLTVSSSAITAVTLLSGTNVVGSSGAGFAVGDALTILGGKSVGSGASLVSHIDSTQATIASGAFIYPTYSGSGYKEGDSVTLTGQTSGAKAQCTLHTNNGSISYFTYNSSQTGFVMGEFLTMSGNTSGTGVGPITVFSLGSGGTLSYAYIYASGSGYQEGQVATLTGNTSGKTAQVTVHLDESGYISYVTVVSSQVGFKAGETSRLSGGSSAVFQIPALYGPLQSISVSAGGSGYINGNAVTITCGTASAQGTLSVTSGTITGVTVTSSGPGFPDNTIVSLSYLISKATGYNLTVLTVDNSDAGRPVTVLAGGSGYCDNDTVTIKGSSSGASAIGSIIAIGGTISGVSVVLPNTFTPGESLVLTPTAGGSGATATAGPSLENHLLIRNALQAIYNAYPGQLKNVVMLGKVPVCRSGINDRWGADGHGNEAPYGADAFYADMDGVVGTDWTDTGDNSTLAYQNYNLPGDKQFDQKTIFQVGNGSVELGFGRIDLSLGIQTEVEAERTYFNKLHRYKTASPDFLPGRMVCDRLSFANERETDLQSMPGVVGMNNIQFISTSNLPSVVAGQDADQLYSAQKGPFLFYFKGSNTPTGGIGGKAVFWTGFQSHWGYWYQAPLLTSGANAMQQRLSENSYTLDFTWNCWGLRYIYHRMGMGFDAGDMMKQSINNQGWGAGPYTYKFNSTNNGDFHGSLHMNQMGDPALRLFMFAPPSALSVVKMGGNPVLSWTASSESSVIGYHVYRAANANAPFTRLTSSPVTATTYTDSTVTAGSYVYMVRAIRLETTGGGSFYNASLGITQSLNLDTPSTAVSILTTSLPTFSWNTSGSATLAAQGGVPQYSWTIISGTLPAGMTLSGAGLLSGMPTGIGNFTFTVQATDQIGQSKTQALTLNVNSNSQITLNPIATTYTAQSAPTYSYGTAEADSIAGNAGSANEAFHRYDLSGVNLYNGFVKATLYLYITANTGTNVYAPVQANLIADAANGWVSNGIAKPFSGAAASPISGYTRINCPNHGFATGTQLTLTGLTGFPSTAYAITSIDTDNFDIYINYGNWAYDPASAFATTVSMTYNTRPTAYNTNVPTLTATGTDTPGTYLQFDVTPFVREVLANVPSKQMGIRFFTTTPQTVTVGSLNAFGNAIPYLVIQTSNAPNITINSPTLNPSFIYSGQGILLNTTVTPLPSRAASLTLQWSQVSGPGTTIFTNPTSATTGASFSTPGAYVLQLTANDGVAQSAQTQTVRVLPTTAPITGPFDSSMILRMPFDETLGTIANDVSGVIPANSGTLAYISGSANPAWAPTAGKIGGALLFSGSGQQVIVPDSTTNPLDGMPKISTSMWIYATSLPINTGTYAGLLSKRIGSFNKESYNIQLRGSTSGTSSPIYVTISGGATLQSVTQVTIGKWYHIAVVFDGTQSANNLQLYVNGSPDKFTTITPTAVPRNSTSNLHIGAFDVSNTAQYIGFSGLIDEVRVYNRALSLPEIQDLYAAAPSNIGPVIIMAPTLSGSVGQALPLTATVSDDNKPLGTLIYNWSELSGPFPLTIATPTSLSTSAVPGLAGLYRLQFSVSDGIITTFANATASITGQTFASWVTANNLTGSNASSTASPAGDGITNLMKYALGLNPNVASAATTDGTHPGMPLFALSGSNITLTYQRDTGKNDITYLVQTTTDLLTWSNIGVTEQIIATNGTIQTVVASIPITGIPKVFIRLQVTK